MPEVLEPAETFTHSAQPLPVSAPPQSTSSLRAYALVIFLSAALLFQIQLIFAKHILPFFGGAPSVWNTCIFCFQVLLLLGYGYAHLLKSRSLRIQRNVHFVLLLVSAILVIALWFKWGTPLTPGAAWKPGPNDNPVWKILQLLSVTVAFPFFIVSTTGPLLQSWAARTKVLPSPYRLYALSNAGSLLGLLTYPFLLEWALTIRHQAWLWSSAYLVFVALCLTIALRLPRETVEHRALVRQAASSAAGPRPARYALWLAFSACSTVILLSSTNFLCENIAAMPLLWVLPLSLYLLTFMLAFDSDRWYSRKIFWPLYAAAIGIVMGPHLAADQRSPLLLIALYCLTIFAVCMVCHGELGRSKPPSEHLTSFYWTIATGGALGGTFVILVAPRIFSGFWEFQGALLACGFLLFAFALFEDRTGHSEAATWPPVLVLLTAFLLPHLGSLVPRLGRFPLINREYFTIPVCFALWLLYRGAFGKSAAQGSAGDRSQSQQLAWRPVAALFLISVFAILFTSLIVISSSSLVFRERNFFGVKYVSDVPNGLAFVSGNTIHGVQLKDPANRYSPTLYFSPQSGVGTLLRAYPRTANDGHLRIGIIGMGVATLASYAQPGDFVRFYEIDPAVVGLSLGPRPIFTFLQHSAGTVEISLGDGRLALDRELALGQPNRFDILVVDAFNSDAVPVHLLTQEAVALYQRHLRGSDSVLLFNVTNRFLDLAPVLRGLAETRHLAIAQVEAGLSNWILLSANPAMLQLPGLREIVRPPSASRPAIVWTDDYSNIFQVFQRARL